MDDPQEQPASFKNDFRSELKQLLNKHNIEGGSNTPDHVLADYLIRCLDNFTETTQSREAWYGTRLVPGRNVNDGSSNTQSMGSTAPETGN